MEYQTVLLIRNTLLLYVMVVCVSIGMRSLLHKITRVKGERILDFLSPAIILFLSLLALPFYTEIPSEFIGTLALICLICYLGTVFILELSDILKTGMRMKVVLFMLFLALSAYLYPKKTDDYDKTSGKITGNYCVGYKFTTYQSGQPEEFCVGMPF